MTFRRLALGTVLLAAAVTPAVAQSSGVSFVGGFVSSTVKISGSDADFDVGSRSGFAAGLTITKSFAGGIDFTPELLYAQKGAKAEEGPFTSTLELTYIQVPLLLRKNFGGSSSMTPFIIAGPSVGYLLDCKETDSDGDNSETSDCDDDDYKKLDFGAMAGAGVAMGRVSLSIRYDLGLADIADSNDDDDSLKNRAIMVMLGVKF